MFQVRTDLALEERERVRHARQDSTGIRVSEKNYENEHVKVTKVYIETPQAAKILAKPQGTYITLETDALCDETAEEMGRIESAHPAALRMADVLLALVRQKKSCQSILVAGLGNRSVTPDALGPRVVDHLMITRHLVSHPEPSQIIVSSITPGVMAQTGMESGEIIAGVISQTHPDCLIVVDALAARNFERLGCTIQITDTGIHPGSGVGNHRHPITCETMGIPVIAIGIPTVVESVAIVQDTMDALVRELSRSDSMKTLRGGWESLDESEHRNLIRELLPARLNTMFVTPKDIDAQIRRMSGVVAEGINLAFRQENEI